MKGGPPHRGVNRVWQREGRNDRRRVSGGPRAGQPVDRGRAEPLPRSRVESPPGLGPGPGGGVECAERENEQLRGLVYENEKLRNRLEGSEHESEQLREEVKQLRAGTERHLREREEIADALTRGMTEAITRLRTQAA